MLILSCTAAPTASLCKVHRIQAAGDQYPGVFGRKQLDSSALGSLSLSLSKSFETEKTSDSANVLIRTSHEVSLDRAGRSLAFQAFQGLASCSASWLTGASRSNFSTLLCKQITVKDGRELVGDLQCMDNYGNIILANTVEEALIERRYVRS